MELGIIDPSVTNELFRSREELTEPQMEEFTGAIRALGVIQAISVRPNPDKLGHYILIAGERRFHASKFAGKKTIPAVVFNVDAETAFKMQVAENVHRKDIHAINEGKAYQRMLDATPGITTNEVALQFGKPESYVLQRLKLNDLLPEISKEFLAGNLLLGHAMQLCRLTEADQQAALKFVKSKYNAEYRSVNELKGFIEQEIMNDLSKAPFDKNDATLCPLAGSCKTCPKRSGATLLFSDIKEKQRCFDRACYAEKSQTNLMNTVKVILETEPETLFLAERHDSIQQPIVALLAEHKAKVLEEYDDFYTNKREDTRKVKGFWLSGEHCGTIVDVYIKKAAEGKVEAESPEQIKAKITARMKRFRELDEEKVYAKILAGLKDHPTQKKVDNKLMKDEETFLWFLVMDKASYSVREEISRKLHIPLNDYEKKTKALAALTPEQRAFMLRRVMMDQYGSNMPTSDYGRIIRKVAEGYQDIDIKGFEAEQKEICDKRESRAKEKIKKLKVETTKMKPGGGKKTQRVKIAA